MLGAGDDLLRRLGSGARPDGVRTRSPRAAIEGMGFGELLDASTRMGGGAAIAVGEGIDLELTEVLRERLGRVADRAVALGLGRIVAVVTSGVIEIDAGRRMVVRAINDSGDEPLIGVDGLAVLTGDGAGDRLFGVGLHGPRPTERVPGPDEHENQGSLPPRSTGSGASIAVAGGANAGMSGGLLALLAGLEAERERSAGRAEKPSSSRE